MNTDAQIQKNVMEELKWQSSVNSSEIGVAVKNGVVTLSGTVGTYLQKKAAEKAAFKVSGVRGVAENIQINIGPDHKRTDSEIAEAAVNALKWNVLVPADHVRIKVENGWVTADGMVEWAYEQKAVKRILASLTGIKGVSNLVKVTPKVDAVDVRQKIAAAFERSAILDANNVQVENFGSKVVLAGVVRSYAERREAEMAAWNAPGVTTVENNIEVTIPSFKELQDQV